MIIQENVLTECLIYLRGFLNIKEYLTLILNNQDKINV